ncbi:MAG: hypothetical protein AMS21_02055 [Gemmatimonas sp. SG8_38_2]|nr:MAG: hypothetical protein AMS21_02055 [Gemmatimonas sp. SG8_38_2]
MTENLVAWKGELILAAATWSDKDGHKVKFRVVGGREGPNPFKYFTKRRKGHAGTRFQARLVKVNGSRFVDSELMLANWTDSSTSGHAVEFWCEPPDEGMHIFEGFERGKDSFMACLVELDDDDEAIDQKARAVVEEAEKSRQRPRKGPQRLSQVAAMMCMNPDFSDWVRQQEPETSDVVQWMRDELGIESRRQLDEDEGVAEMFHEQIRKPFAEWIDRGKTPF